MDKTYKLLNLNVHNFRGEYYANLERFLEEFVKYDIISLQEVYNFEVLKEIVKGYNYSYNKGLLLMTKYNIEIVQSKVLNERYTSLLIHPSLNDTFFITSVHNRHLDDNLQKEELEDILEKILGYTNEYPSVLLGEMGSFLDTYFSDWLNQRGNINSVSTKNTISRFKHAKKIYPLRGGYEYNNLMYAVSGEVIGSVSGVHWTKFVEKNILDPLEMNNTKTKASEIFDGGNYVTPYLDDIEKGIIEVNYNLSDQIGAAGMIWSCVNDIQNYLQFLTNDGVYKAKRILKKETFNYLFNPHIMIPPESFYPTQKLTKPNWISYGLGWFQHDYRGEKIDFHTGSIEGLIAIAGIIHDKNIAVYVFGNMDHAELRHAIMYKAFDLFAFDNNSFNWHKEVFSLYEDYRDDMIKTNNRQNEARVLNTKTTLNIKKYAGDYKNKMLGNIEVKVINGQLELNCNNFLNLTASHWHFDSFLSEKNNRYKMKTLFNFNIDQEGKIKELIFMGNKFTKASP